MQSENFDAVYEGFAQGFGCAKDEIVLTHLRMRVYPYAKPTSLKMRAGQSYTLKAWLKDVYDQVLTQRGSGSLLDDVDVAPGEAGPAGAAADPTATAGGVGNGHASAGASDGEEDGPREGFIRLTLKEAGGKRETRLQVRPARLAGKVLEHWCRTWGIEEGVQARMWLECEGERLDLASGVGENEDVEDECQIDVVGPR